MALEGLGEEIHGADVVVVGAGQLAAGVAKSLLGSAGQIATVTICNRTIEKAQSLRDEIGDTRVLASGLDDIEAAIQKILDANARKRAGKN